jgi:hypothetical protein
MPGPPYRTLRVVWGFLSLFMAIGGVVLIFFEQGPYSPTIPPSRPRRKSQLCFFSLKEMGGLSLRPSGAEKGFMIHVHLKSFSRFSRSVRPKTPSSGDAPIRPWICPSSDAPLRVEALLCEYVNARGTKPKLVELCGCWK